MLTRFGSRSLDNSTSKTDPDTGLKRTIANLLPFFEAARTGRRLSREGLRYVFLKSPEAGEALIMAIGRFRVWMRIIGRATVKVSLGVNE